MYYIFCIRICVDSLAIDNISIKNFAYIEIVTNFVIVTRLLNMEYGNS